MKAKSRIHQKSEELQANSLEAVNSNQKESNLLLKSIDQTLKRPIATVTGLQSLNDKQRETNGALLELKESVERQPESIVNKLEEVKSAGLVTNKFLKDIRDKEAPTEMMVELKGVSLVTIKGDKGDDSKPEEVAAVLSNDQAFLAKVKGDEGKPANPDEVAAKLASNEEFVKKTKGKDGKNVDENRLMRSIIAKLPPPEKGDAGYTPKKGVDYNDGKDGSPDTPDEVVDKVNKAKKKISFSQLKDVPDFSKLDTMNQSGYVAGGPAPILFQDEGVTITQSPILKLNVVGAGGSIVYSGGGLATLNLTGGGVGGGHTIEDEGTPLTQRTNLNFVGAGVTVTDDAGNDATVVTIDGGGGTANAYAEVPTGAVDGVNDEYTLAHTPADTDGVIVLLDGVTQYNGVDYTVSGDTITFSTAPVTGSTIFAYYNTLVSGGGTPTAITVANEASDTTSFPLFVTAATGDLGPKTNANLRYDASIGRLENGPAGITDLGGYLTNTQNIFVTSAQRRAVTVLKDHTGTGGCEVISGILQIRNASGTAGGAAVDMEVFIDAAGNQGNPSSFYSYVEKAGAGTTNSFTYFYADSAVVNAGAITTVYGLQIADQTAGGTNYAIKTGLGLVEFGELAGSGTRMVVADADGVLGEGVASSSVVTLTGTQTLTNKRVTKRVVTTTDDATSVIDCDVTDDYELTAIANATTFSVTGTPTDGQTIFLRFKDAGVAKGLTWTGITALGVTLPTTTVAGKWHLVGLKYFASDTAWYAVGVSVQA